MSNKILTNKVKEFNLNLEELSKNFEFYKLKFFDKTDYAKKIKVVKETLKPLSYLYYDKQTYFALCKKNSVVNDNPEIVIKKITIHDIISNFGKVIIARMLLRAIPALKTKKYFEADGLYYLVNSKKFKNFTCFTAVNIDFKSVSFPIDGDILSVKTQTFSPRMMFTDNKVIRLPKFEISLFKKHIEKNSDGIYVKRGIPNRKAATDMIDISGDDLLNFNKSRCGYIKQAEIDIKEIYGDSFSFELDYAESDFRHHASKQEIENNYEEVINILRMTGVHICDVVNNDDEACKLATHLINKYNINSSFSSEINSNVPNLLIVHDPEFCLEYHQNDEYSNLKLQDPFSQAIINNKIFASEKIDEHQLLASLKELVIKFEIKNKSFLIKELTGNWSFLQVQNIKIADDEDVLYHLLSVSQNKISYEKLNKYQWINKSENNFEINDRQYVVVNHDDDNYVLITESDIKAIPNYNEIYKNLVSIKNSKTKKIPLSAIIQYADTISRSDNKSEKQLCYALKKIIEKNLNIGYVMYEELHSNKITYQGVKQKFYDFLRDEYGIFLKTSFKSKNGYLSSSLGFFYSSKSSCYFAGSHEGIKSTIKNFCQFRHVETDYAEIPDKLWNQFDAFYIRHKQSTVLPFPFKYLRELINMHSV